jgi:hypothetical protein
MKMPEQLTNLGARFTQQAPKQQPVLLKLFCGQKSATKHAHAGKL